MNKKITENDRLINMINSKISLLSHFSFETQDKEEIAILGQKIINSLSDEQLIKILGNLFPKDIKFWEIKLGDNNDGTSCVGTFKGTRYEIEEYIKKEYIGRQKKWDRDGDDQSGYFIRFPYRNNAEYTEIIEFFEISEDDYNEHEKSLCSLFH